MNNDYLKELNVFITQYNYKLLTNYIINLQKHINTLYSYNMITLYNRNILIGNIHQHIKMLNNNYNDFIINQSEIIDDKIQSFLDDAYDKDMSVSTFYNYLLDVNVVQNNEDLAKFLNPLNNIRKKIIKLSHMCGNTNIDIILQVIQSPIYKSFYNDKTIQLLDFLNVSFIPLEFTIVNEFFTNEVIDINNDMEDDNLSDDEKNIKEYFTNVFVHTKKINKDDFLNRVVSVNIRNIYNNSTIIINGIFITDSINVTSKTCQMANKFIYLKKKMLENKLFFTETKATKKFKKAYFKYLSIYEIFSFNTQNLIENINDNYDKYIDLISKTFMNIMKDFIRKNNSLSEMFQTIRLLLLGNEENINVAGLLFGITKDKKINSMLISNIIYRNLHYASQIKLKKTVSTMKDELEKIQALTLDDIDYKKQLLTLQNIPLNIKALAFEKIEEMKSSNNEYHKQLQYIKTIIRFPWSSNKDNIIFEELNNNVKKRINFIDNIEGKLKSLTYGHTEAKRSLLETVGKWITNPDSGGGAISFFGPPGVGKTLLAKSIGDALDIPFVQITLGGQNDGELLHGHGYTYSGAQPGMIVKKMIEAGSSRCVMYFDELDKACSKRGSANEITSILIHLTDPNMNKTFQDRFFQGVDFPLDKVIMIFSYNDPKLIDPILLDRFQEIEITPYSVKDKICIFEKFMFKEVCKDIKFDPKDFVVKKNVIKYLIDKYTMEAGVRGLKRKIEKLLLHLNIDRLYNRGLFKSNKQKIHITKKLIETILSKPKLEVENIHDKPLIGVINGLYATSIGTGGIVPIQIFDSFVGDTNNFTLKLTGNQGKVMKESVECAFTCAVNHISRNLSKYGITDLKKHLNEHWNSGFHIHAPSGSTPKDGPSAGCAFTTAFISIIINKPIDNKMAMTGEIELTGNITKIGGLEYKINGAKKAGVTKILISTENKSDLLKIKKDNKDLLTGMKIIMVNNIDEIIEHAILFE
jgi:endopeptidase La